MRRAILLALMGCVMASAQCAMCYRTAQALNKARGRALNSGIFILGTPPLVLLAGFVVLVVRRNKASEKGHNSFLT